MSINRPEHSKSNHLLGSSSPYLRQHAHNPIDWYPWGEEALSKAKRENKPIFLSIGYSTCYWCHVMEREVFENEAIAQTMNAWCVSIKVDREERPEIDEIYMVARQLMTQEGGWPNNVFLTPDLKPFYAVGTMAADERYGKWSFPKLIASLQDGWMNKRDEVIASSERAADAIIHFMQEQSDGTQRVPLTADFSEHFLKVLSDYMDDRDGGFFNAPKFPHENFLLFLMKCYKRNGNSQALEMAKLALDKMAAGGICDQVGGGFHRYSVDKAWRVPHFEKMLYTQALMARCYEEMFACTGDSFYRDTAEDVLQYVLRNLRSDTGAFYTAQDAETDAIEGAHYVWNSRELDAVLNAKEKALFDSVYGLDEVPAFHGHAPVDGKVMYSHKPLPELAASLGITYEALRESLVPVKAKLLAYRQKNHTMPRLDHKLIVSWNGLMIDAFALAGQTFGKPEYIEIADKAAHYLFEKARLPDGRLARIVTDGVAMFDAYLEDYAYMMDGLLSLYRATQKQIYLDETLDLFERADRLFFDAEHGRYFYTDGEERLFVRIKQAADMALPSSTAVMIHNMLDLFEITGEQSWKERAHSLLDNYSGHIARASADYCTMIHALLRYVHL